MSLIFSTVVSLRDIKAQISQWQDGVNWETWQEAEIRLQRPRLTELRTASFNQKSTCFMFSYRWCCPATSTLDWPGYCSLPPVTRRHNKLLSTRQLCTLRNHEDRAGVCERRWQSVVNRKKCQKNSEGKVHLEADVTGGQQRDRKSVVWSVTESLTSLMSSSSSAGLQSMSVISPELVVAAMVITELFPSESRRTCYASAHDSNSFLPNWFFTI